MVGKAAWAGGGMLDKRSPCGYDAQASKGGANRQCFNPHSRTSWQARAADMVKPVQPLLFPDLPVAIKARPKEWKAAEYLVALESSLSLGGNESHIVARAGSLSSWQDACAETCQAQVYRLRTALSKNNWLKQNIAKAGIAKQLSLFEHSVILGDDARKGIVADVEIVDGSSNKVFISVKHNSSELKSFRISEESLLRATGVSPGDSLKIMLDCVASSARLNDSWDDMPPEDKKRLLSQVGEKFADYLHQLDDLAQAHFVDYIIGKHDYYLLSFGTDKSASWVHVPASSINRTFDITKSNKVVLLGSTSRFIACELRIDNKDKKIKRSGIQVKFNLKRDVLA